MTINQVLSLVLFPLGLTIGYLCLQRGKNIHWREALPPLLFAMALTCWSIDLIVHPVYTEDIMPIGLYVGSVFLVCAVVTLCLKSGYHGTLRYDGYSKREAILMPILIHVSVALQRQDALLLVQERKPENYERWNLPGGHLELGETPQQGAIREAAEETGLSVVLSELVGIYTTIRQPSYEAIRFVFAAHFSGDPIAGSDILAVRWFTLTEMEALPDAALVGGERLRRIVADIASKRRYPLSLLTEPT